LINFIEIVEMKDFALVITNIVKLV